MKVRRPVGADRYVPICALRAKELYMTQNRKMLRMKHLLERLALSRSTILRMEKAGEFPARVQLSSRAVGYCADAVDAWLASRPTAARGGVQ
jgi:predicted DNA-binding transcriptional regulator AlpA